MVHFFLFYGNDVFIEFAHIPSSSDFDGLFFYFFKCMSVMIKYVGQ